MTLLLSPLCGRLLLLTPVLMTSMVLLLSALLALSCVLRLLVWLPVLSCCTDSADVKRTGAVTAAYDLNITHHRDDRSHRHFFLQ